MAVQEGGGAHVMARHLWMANRSDPGGVPPNPALTVSSGG